MKTVRKVLTILLAALTVLSLSAPALAADWTDVPKDSWYAGYINTVVDAGLMNGVGENKFDPNATLSRAMFVTILNRAAGGVEVQSNTAYSDVAEDAWYDRPVQWAETQGVVNGYPDGRFGVNDPLTREQMFTILYRYFTANGKAEAPADALDRFTDKGNVSAYAVDAYRWAVSQNIFYELEKNTLNPRTACSRGEAAAVIARFMEYADKNYKKLTRADLEAAVGELGMDYHIKGGKIQYDSENMSSVFTKYYGGHYRLTENALPEYGTKDTTIFSVCSDYMFKSYYAALGHRIFGAQYYMDSVTDSYWKHSESEGIMLIRWAKSPDQITEEDEKFGATKASLKTKEELNAFVRDWRNTMRPGDVVMSEGHALLHIGNGYIMDVAGSKYNMTTGMDAVEPTGAIKCIVHIEDLFFSEDTSTGIHRYHMESDDPSPTRIIILRPLDVLVVDDGDKDPGNDVVKSSIRALPKATKTRLQYKGLEIDRTVNITPYGTTFTGDTLTYNVAVSNLSNHVSYLTWKQAEDKNFNGVAYKGLAVTEKIPAGTELVEGSVTEGGTYKDGTITWTVDLAAGAVKNLTYKVKVTAKQGEEIVSTGGYVGNILSNTIVNRVGGKKLGDVAVEGLKKFGATPANKWRETYNISVHAPDTAFAERVYAKAAGIELELPSVQQLVYNLLESKTMTNPALSRRYYGTKTGTVLTFRQKVAPEFQIYKDMIVKDALGGRLSYFPKAGMTINEFKDNYFEVGDIIVWANVNKTGKVSDTSVLVQTGDKQAVLMSSDGLAATVSGATYLSSVATSFSKNIFFVLRPSQALADVNARAYDASKEPVYKEEPTLADQTSVPLSQENIDKFKALQNKTDWNVKTTNTAFAEDIYSMVGLDLKAVTNSTSIVNITRKIFQTNSNMVGTSAYQYVPIANDFVGADGKAIHAMQVDGYRGGPDMLDDGTLVKDPKVSDLQVGDVLYLVRRNGSVYWTGVYLGDSKMVLSEYRAHEGGYKETKVVTLTDESYSTMLKTNYRENTPWEFFLVLRPSQGFADINTGKLFEE